MDTENSGRLPDKMRGYRTIKRRERGEWASMVVSAATEQKTATKARNAASARDENAGLLSDKVIVDHTLLEKRDDVLAA